MTNQKAIALPNDSGSMLLQGHPMLRMSSWECPPLYPLREISDRHGQPEIVCTGQSRLVV